MNPAEHSLDIVRRLSSGQLRRDPDVKPWRAPRRAPVIVVPFEDREPLRVVNGDGGRASGYGPKINPEEIVDFVRRHPGTAAKEIAAHLARPKATVYQKLEQLVGEGRLERTGEWNVRYSVV